MSSGSPGGRKAKTATHAPDPGLRGSGAAARPLVGEAIRRLVDANVVGIAIGDTAGCILEANDYYLALIGYTREELEAGKINWWAITPPEWLHADQRAIRELSERGVCSPYEKEYLRRDGTRVPVLLADARLKGEKDKLAAFVLDRTAQRKAEAAWQANEERYRSLFQNMLNGLAYCRMIFDQDRPVDFVYLAVNDAFSRLTGLKDVVGRRVSEVVPGIRAADPLLFEVYGRVARTGKPEVFETFVEALQNWFFISVYCPAPDHFVAVFDVITERKQAEQKLRLFRELIERSGDAIEVVDPATARFLDVNETACRILGYTREELLARTVFDVDREIDRAAFEATVDRMTREGNLTFETRRWRKDGTSFMVEISLSTVVLDRTYFVAIVRDVTERRRLAEELHLQSAALNAAANAILITDAAGIIEWANPAFTAISGFSMAESVGRNPGELVRSGAHGPPFYREMWETILAGRVWHGQLENRRKDGSVYTEEMTITPVRGAGGKITHFIAIKNDVSDRKRAEARLTEQATLLDRASDAIYVTAMDCTILYWNPAAARIYGWTAAEALGRKTTDLMAVEEVGMAEARTATVERGEWIGERRQKRKSGQPVDVLSRLTLVRDANGRPRSILVINTDITEQKELEARFLRAQRLESIGALASGMAHDLNNVLAPILMAAPLLRDAATDDTTRNLLTLMETSARRGADIVRQVLTFARGSEGQRIMLQPVHLVRDMVRIIAETFPKNIEVETRAAAEIWSVEGDATQLHQALLNLCVNARDAMPEGGVLTVGAENVALDDAAAARIPGARAGRFVRLRVADTGTGIPPEVQDRIFEPFFTTKGVGKGTGLGLSTVLGIMKSHQGFVRVESAPGRGSTFDLYVPAAAEARTTRDSAAAFSALPWPRADGEWVMVVDDEAAVREVARQALEEFGYRVATYGTGTEAIEGFRIARSEIRLVVTDMMMPEMDGPTLVQALRAVNPEVRIVGITGTLDPPELARVEALALAALLAKPFSVGDLLDAVGKAAKGAVAATPRDPGR